MKRTNRFKQPGQSVPLLAAMIVVIVAMVGLSVDVGNAYGQQRRVQNVATAGALAGMNSVMNGQKNIDVWNNVQRTMAGNRVDNSGPEYSYRADYILDNKQVELLGTWNGSTAYVPKGAEDAPNNIVRVQVTLTEKVGTYFARVVGRNELVVTANGNACLGGYSLGVYPVGVPLRLAKTATTNKGTQPYHRIFRTNGAELPTSDERWGQWDDMIGMTVYLPVENNDNMSGTHISWLDWAGNSNASDLKASLTYPGDLQNGFEEGQSQDSNLKTGTVPGKLELGDWIDGKTGVDATAEDYLRTLGNDTRDLILPMYDAAGGNGSNGSFHITKMGRFRMKAAYLKTPDKTAGLVYDKYLKLQYLGEATTAPTSCSSEPNPDKTYVTGKRFNIDGVAKVNRVYRTQATNAATYDVVLVMDTSDSMGKDWNDQDSGAANARLEDAKRVIKEFVRSYDIGDDPDARMAFVTFSGSDNAGNLKVTTRVGWKRACTTSKIANNCKTNPTDSDSSGLNNKWSDIQNSASSMTASGYTPGPLAFEKVEDLLQDKRTPPSGKTYGQIVLFATDGVFNVCGTDRGTENCSTRNVVPCPSNNWTTCLGTASYNMVSGRPVWQAQQVAGRIKNSGARIFMVALAPSNANFDTQGLSDMSSGTGYYYSAANGSALSQIYATIKGKLEADRCVPREQAGELAEGVQLTLTQPNNPTFSKTVASQPDGTWNFTNLQAGNYVVKVSADYALKSSEDGKTRNYIRVRNGLNLAEETQASVTIHPQYPNGATVHSEVLLSLPFGTDGAPLNACNTGY